MHFFEDKSVVKTMKKLEEESPTSSSSSSSSSSPGEGSPMFHHDPSHLLPEEIHIIRNFYPSIKNNCVASFAGFSLKGQNAYYPMKPNQDSFLMMEDNLTNSLVIACLDGHGVNGHHISQYFKGELTKRLFSHPLFQVDVEGAVRSTLKLIELDLFKQHSSRAEYSGTTLSMAIIRGHEIWVINIGDSRIVLASKSQPKSDHSQNQSEGEEENKEPLPLISSSSSNHTSLRKTPSGHEFVAHDVTIDHKPHLPLEFARICSNGGRVFSIRYENGEVGPPRVWMGQANVPGLAMSRSLGDFVVHTAGVISTPDIFHYRIDEEVDSFLIVGTDGLWDTLKSQEAVNIAKNFSKPADAVKAALTLSSQRWASKDTATDDTTVCMVYFNGFHPTEEALAINHLPPK